MNPVEAWVWIALLESCVYFLLASYVMWRRDVSPRAVWWAFIYCLLGLFWALVLVAGQLGWLAFLDPYFLLWIPAYGIAVLAFFFLYLSRAALNIPGAGWRWLLLGLVWLVGEVILGFNLFGLPATLIFVNGWAFPLLSVLWWLLVFGWVACVVGATAATLRILKKRGRSYTVASYWMVVLFLVVLGEALFLAGARIWGSGLSLAGAALAVYVVSMPRLVHLVYLVRRSLSYLIFAALAIVIYAAGIAGVDWLFRGWQNYNPWWVGLILALILVLLFDPLLNRVRKWTNQSILGSPGDPTSLLRKYSHSITNILDLHLLANVTVGTAGELLGVERGYLFLVNLEKGPENQNEYHLRGVKGLGDTEVESGRLTEESPLGIYFRQERQPLTCSEVNFQPRFRDLSAEERSWFERLDMEVFIPIHAKNEWIGLLALGSKGTGEAYSDEDLLLLNTLANQTAVALENTRLVEGLMRLNNDFRRAYAALDEANHHLERLDRSKSDFISVASHELLTPLTLISGACQMLLEESEIQQNSYQKELLSKMDRGTTRLQEIVDDMLEIAKIDTRVLELETQPVSFQDLVGAVYFDLKAAAQSRKQTIHMQNIQDLPPVIADMEALRKVFHHLVINAIKFTPDGGKITISGCELPPDAVDWPTGGVEIVVSDTGIGIDPKFQELIFVKFYQTGEIALHSSGKTKFKGGGPGLGLTIARGIIEAHQGKIWVESPGYDEANCPGSKFHVVLPIRPLQRPGIPKDVASIK